MKLFELLKRQIALLFVLCCFVCLGSQPAQAQSTTIIALPAINCVPAVGELCTPAYSTTVNVAQLGPITINFTASAGHCSDIQVLVFLDNTLLTTSVFLAPGVSTGPIVTSSVSPGSHTIALQANGRPGGCNSGDLRSWTGTLAITQGPPPQWMKGDVFVGIGTSQYQVFRNTSTTSVPNYVLVETLNDLQPSGFTTGCALDSSFNLYTTNFSNNKVVKFDANSPHSVLQTIDTTGSGEVGFPDNESIAFAANGDFFVGHADGLHHVQRYNAAGVLQQTYAVAIESGGRGSDWVVLSSDQHTLFYTSEGTHIKRFDVSANEGTGMQLTDFPNLSGAPGPLFALRLLPPGDGSGGLLVADTADIKRLDNLGNVVRTYAVDGESFWFALNLDPDGTSFWSGGIVSGKFYKFDIATGNILAGPILSGAGNTFTPPSLLGGICVRDEPTAVNTVTLNYTPSTTPQTKITTFGQPSDPAASSMAITLNSVINPITATLEIHYEPTDVSTGTHGVGIADGICEVSQGANESNDHIDCGLAKGGFVYKTLTNGDQVVPHIIPSHNNMGVWYRVNTTAQANIDYTSPVNWYGAWNTNPALNPSPNPDYPPGWNNMEPNMFDRPGANVDPAFVFNITTFIKFSCDPNCVGTIDPGTGGKGKTLNDIVVADIPFSASKEEANLLLPFPGISPFPYLKILPIGVIFTLENESIEKSDPTATTFPHTTSIAVLDPNGVPQPIQPFGTLPTTFTYNKWWKFYSVVISPAPYTPGVVYTLQVNSDLFPAPLNAKFVVK